jgi:hypothetical protein
MNNKNYEKKDRNLIIIGLVLLASLFIIGDKINESNRDLENHQEKMKLINKIPAQDTYWENKFDPTNKEIAQSEYKNLN